MIDDGSHSTTLKHLNGPGIDNKLSLKTGSDVKYFLADHLGSTNGLADATGSLTAQTAYDSFGNQTANLPTRYGFTGRERDDFTGLVHYRARHYDPRLGRRVSGFLLFFLLWFEKTSNGQNATGFDGSGCGSGATHSRDVGYINGVVSDDSGGPHRMLSPP